MAKVTPGMLRVDLLGTSEDLTRVRNRILNLLAEEWEPLNRIDFERIKARLDTIVGAADVLEELLGELLVRLQANRPILEDPNGPQRGVSTQERGTGPAHQAVEGEVA
jgi:hypothetical protein